MKIEELSKEPIRLLDVLKTAVGDVYYQSIDSEQYLHIRTSSWTPDQLEGRPMVIEVYDRCGKKIIDKSKRYESNSAFSLIFPLNIRNSKYIKLSGKPSAISVQNVDYASRVSPSVF